MPRSARALLALTPVLALACACGGGDTPTAAPPASTAAGPAPSPSSASTAPAPATSASATPSPSLTRSGNRPVSDYPDACRLLTRKDVAAVYPVGKVSAAAPQRGSVGGTAVPRPIGCSYEVQAGRVLATVSLRVGTLVYDAQHFFDVGKTIDVPDLKPLSIGDEAYDPGRSIPTTKVLVDGLDLEVEVNDGRKRAAQPTTEALARRIVDNVRSGGADTGVSS